MEFSNIYKTAENFLSHRADLVLIWRHLTRISLCRTSIGPGPQRDAGLGAGR